MALNVGDRLGHYGVTALIGEGGMGEVYKATDTRLERTVAIKVLPAHVAADPDLRQRFEREAQPRKEDTVNHSKRGRQVSHKQDEDPAGGWPA